VDERCKETRRYLHDTAVPDIMGVLSSLPFGGFFFSAAGQYILSSISYILAYNPHKILTA